MARKILLADDSVTAQNMGRKILADAGYEVIAVNNGSAALKKIAELKPDLVILDVYMPGYSGLEVCQRLKESQETSRIPVLLSVGKLEPFKPEEAQRVRADGYIVKPFEASELLSALSKLEDKVVPRAEPSKPGRFARAIAAAEESSRGNNPTAGEQNGWKSRIGFPHEKTESAEKVADESTIYNPMNRDLRTVVETAGEKAAEKAAHEQEEEKRHQDEKVAEASLDLAALAPTGLPKDVTPEEVAAIAAAAAQIQMAGAGIKDEPQASEGGVAEKQVAEAMGQATAEVVSHSAEGSVAPAPEVAAETKLETLAGEAAAEAQHNRRIGDRELQDVPVTMAATAESVVAASAAARWTAVPVALEGDDATVSLDQEMQKAYAGFASGAPDSGPVASVPETKAEEAAEAPLAAMPIPEAVSEPEPATRVEPRPAEAAPVMPSEVAASSFEPAAPTLVTAEAERVEARAEAVPTSDFKPEQPPMPVSEFMSPVSEAEVAGLAGLVGLSADSQLAPEDDAATAQATTATSKPFARIVRVAEDKADEHNPDPETVKSSAAAWASWRQVRDTSKGSEEVQANEFEVPESGPAESARAVAAGAEQTVQEAADAAPSGDSNNVASIVDSVLADLRPKLMAEISRKMAEKK